MYKMIDRLIKAYKEAEAANNKEKAARLYRILYHYGIVL